MERVILAKRTLVVDIGAFVMLALAVLCVVFCILKERTSLLIMVFVCLLSAGSLFAVMGFSPKILAEYRDGKIVLHPRRKEVVELAPEQIINVSKYNARGFLCLSGSLTIYTAEKKYNLIGVGMLYKAEEKMLETIRSCKTKNEDDGASDPMV